MTVNIEEEKKRQVQLQNDRTIEENLHRENKSKKSQNRMRGRRRRGGKGKEVRG